MEQGSYEKAIVVYETLLKEQAENLDYIIGLTTAYQQTEAYQKADSLLLNALKTSPLKPILEVELGYNYQLQGQDEQAQVLYNKAIAGVAENLGFANRVGNAFKKYNLLDLAIKTYKTAEATDPRYNFDSTLAPLYDIDRPEDLRRWRGP